MMPNLYIVLDVIVVVALLGIAVTVLLKNSKVELNRIFAQFVAFVSIWILANYISNDTTKSSHTAIIANYFVFFFSYAAGVYSLRFAIELADDKKARRVFTWLSLPLLAVGLLSFTPWLVEGASVQGSVYAVHFGPALPIYALSLLVVLASGIYVIYRNMRRATGNQKARLRVLFNSFAWTLPLLLVLDFLLPTTTGWFGLTNIGILPMLILVYGLYYSVIRHKLFDLKFIIVRSLGYVVTLTSISVMYGISSYYATRAISRYGNIALSEFMNITLIIIVVVSYAPVKALFDKLTSRIFYRDQYDPEQFISEINKEVVATLSLNKLLLKAADVIARNMKAEFCVFALWEPDGHSLRFFGTSKREFKTHGIETMLKAAKHSGSVIMNVDYLADDRGPEKAAMEANNIAMFAHMTGDASGKHDGVGFILVGVKKNGSPYSSKDNRTLETISNGLIVAIQNALRFEEIQNFNATLQQKVEEATRQLRRTNAKLEALDETKDDFISMASHQLRTPLTSVKGYLSMVLEGDAGKITPLQRKMIAQAFTSSQRMVFLIADLLNVSRLKTGKFVIEPAPVNLATMAQDEINQLKETAAAHEIELVYHHPKGFPELMLDETKTRQVVMNFLDNAIYYTPTGGRIELQLHDTGPAVELRIVDNGIGVPRAEQHHLFTKFYRAANARRKRPDGTGLGLFMAKKVITAQGGAVIFESTEGKGSTFGFVVSKAKLAVPGANAPEPALAK